MVRLTLSDVGLKTVMLVLVPIDLLVSAAGSVFAEALAASTALLWFVGGAYLFYKSGFKLYYAVITSLIVSAIPISIITYNYVYAFEAVFLAVAGIAIAGVVYVFDTISLWRQSLTRQTKRDPAAELARERYARGEISKEQLSHILQDLQQLNL